MPFQLPDLRAIPTRPAVPTPILVSYTPVPTSRPGMTQDQLRARARVHEAWHRPLTHLQRRFIGALYANGFDETAAAFEADPSITTEYEARKVSKRWMRLPSIKAAIEAVHAYYTETTKIRYDDLVAELKAIAFSDISNFWDASAEAVTLPPAGDIRYKSISEFSMTPTRYGRALRIKQYDKLSAIEKLLKLHTPLADPAQTKDDGNVYVNVQTVNIMPVPQGMYLPAPVIENESPMVIDKTNSVLSQVRTLPERGALVPTNE